ncbi:MAG TPA: serine O-acetyltransferase [Chloroflexota bacterium]|nr:serine O-acetyltransferase [Chloroflexota bacterium]
MSIAEDVQAIFERDPAATNLLEVLLTYPGLHALLFHRLAHRLHRRGVPLLPRLISHLNRWLTGIEIHPGATIGRGFFIDHGMGVVIGETSEIGDNVTLYQGVTLGGTGKEKGKRHPTLGNDVMVGVGAKILGAVNVGDHARIGAGAVVLSDVPSHATAVGVPAKVVVFREPDGSSRRVEHLPDPELDMISALNRKIDELTDRLNVLESSLRDDVGGPRDDDRPIRRGRSRTAATGRGQILGEGA